MYARAGFNLTAEVLEFSGNDVTWWNEVEMLDAFRLLKALNVLKQSVFSCDFVRPEFTAIYCVRDN